ncbi:hypothetical protein FBQ87_09075 [Sphingobacteriales bacterium CHB3]|nr:hypothetical protein [Sphingobacteriales bacterium CHB3]
MNKLLAIRGRESQGSETSGVYQFLRDNLDCEDSLVRQFADSLREDLPELLQLLKRLSVSPSQLELFSSRLRRYAFVLRDLGEEDGEHVSEFFLELTYHLMKDMENYLYSSDELEQEQEILELELEEAGSDSASFGFCAI